MVHANVPGDLNDERAANIINQFLNFNFETYDAYTTAAYNVCILREDLTRNERYNCTCHVNAKQFSCIHSVGVAIIKGFLVPPAAARATLLGRRRRRGRRPMAAPAWQHQPYDIRTPPAHPQQDPAILAGQAPDPGLALVAAAAALAANDIAAQH